MSRGIMDSLTTIQLIGAIELGSAWMLGWLAAAAIPLALHLLHRRRQQEMPWAAIELLMQAIRQNSRTIRMEQWLLLLLRTLAMLLFAVALARPLLRSLVAADTETIQPPRHWVLVMDSSYSMGVMVDRKSLWDQAKQRAISLVEQASASDAFSLIQLAEPSLAIIGQPAFDKARVIDELQRMKCSDEGGDLTSGLQLVEQAIAESAGSGGTADRAASDIEIVFFTDLGRDTWQAATSASATGGVTNNTSDRRVLEQLSTRHTVRVERVSAQSPANLAVTALEAESPLVMQGRTLQCAATIHNFGPQTLERVPVQFQSAGATQRTEVIQCPAGQSRTVVVELPAPSSVASWDISVQLPDDALAIDNQRHVIVSVRPQIRVITVEETAGAARLVNLSLSPLGSRDASNNSVGNAMNGSMSVESWSPVDIESRELSDIDVVVLVDLTHVNEAIVSKLNNFVNRGGAVLGLLGAMTRPESFNVLGGADPNPSSSITSLEQLFGFALREPTTIGDWRVDPLGYTSPIAKPFANYLDAGLLTTPIFRYWKIEPQKSISLIRDLDFATGDAWIVRRSLGAGSVGAMLSAPESGVRGGNSQVASWNAVATWPSFVPIMQKLVETLVVGSAYERNGTVGQPLRGYRFDSTSPAELRVRRPDNTINKLTLPVGSNNGRNDWNYSQTDRAGIYQVSLVTGDASSEPVDQNYAVNIVPNQSDLQSVSTESLPLGTNRGSNTSSRLAVTRDAQTGQGNGLVQGCLTALLIVLAMESLLAWHLGRRLT